MLINNDCPVANFLFLQIRYTPEEDCRIKAESEMQVQKLCGNKPPHTENWLMSVPSQAAGTNTSQHYEQKITLAVNLSPFSQLPLEIRVYFQAQFHACLSDGYKEDFSHNAEFETFSKQSFATHNVLHRSCICLTYLPSLTGRLKFSPQRNCKK